MVLTDLVRFDKIFVLPKILNDIQFAGDQHPERGGLFGEPGFELLWRNRASEPDALGSHSPAFRPVSHRENHLFSAKCKTLAFHTNINRLFFHPDL